MSLVCAYAAFFAAPALAQAPRLPAEPLTLDQALALAESTSESIAAAQAAVRRAAAEQQRAQSGRRPQLSASAGYDRALATEFAGVFDSDSFPRCDPFTLNPAAPLDARVAEIERAIDCGAIGASLFGGDGDDAADLPFGRANTWRVGLSLSQAVYSGGRFAALDRMAAAGQTTAALALRGARAQLLFDVAEAYYDAALSSRLVAIAEATLGQADDTLRLVRASFDAGAQPEFELLRAQVSRDNQRPALIRARASRDVALLRLKQLLDLPPDTAVELAAALGDDVMAPPAPFAESLARVGALVPISATQPASAAPALVERTAVREADALVSLREAALAAAEAERRPSVAVTSNFSQVAYPSAFFPTGGFRTNWTVGAAVQVPVLTGGRLAAEQRIAQAELDQSRAQKRQIEELAALDTRAAWAELAAAQAAWEASAGTVQQATRAYDIAEVRFGAGVSTQLELADARLLLQQAEANRAQAARDLQVARARVALLPELPIGGGAAARPATLPSPTFAAPAVPAPTPRPPAGASPAPRNAAAQAQGGGAR